MSERRSAPQKVIPSGTRVTDAAAVRSAWRRQRVRAGVVVTLAVLAVAGVALSVILSLDTQGRVEVASRCQNGDLFACRATAENLRRACSKPVLSKLPAKLRSRETRKCAALKMGATARKRQRADGRRDRREARRERRARRRRDTREPTATRPRQRVAPAPRSNPTPSAPRPSEPSPAPASGPSATPTPAPTPRPIVTVPREIPLPCVKVLNVVDCG